MSRSELIELVSRLQKMGMDDTAERVLLMHGKSTAYDWIESVEIAEEPPMADFSDLSLDELLEVCYVPELTQVDKQ